MFDSTSVLAYGVTSISGCAIKFEIVRFKDPTKRFVDPTVGPWFVALGQDVSQISLQVDIVELASLNEAGHKHPVLRTILYPSKGTVFLVYTLDFIDRFKGLELTRVLADP